MAGQGAAGEGLGALRQEQVEIDYCGPPVVRYFIVSLMLQSRRDRLRAASLYLFNNGDL